MSFIRGTVRTHTIQPASGLFVQARRHDSRNAVTPIGQTTTDARGEFAIEYPAAAPRDRRRGPALLSVAIYADAELQTLLATSATVEESASDVALDVILPPPNAAIDVLSERLERPLSREITRLLRTSEIHTLADLRSRGALRNSPDLAGAATVADTRVLNAMGALSVVEAPPALYAALADRDVRTVFDLAMLPREELRAAAGEAIDDSVLDALAGEASISAIELGNAVIQRKLSKRKDDGTAAFDDLFRVTCRCSCASAASAQAYLAHLLRFTLHTVRYQRAAIDLGRLQSMFRQPFRDLPATCESSETMVAQARIAVEVLRQHLRAANNAAATSSPQWYRETAYLALIQVLGLTYDDLREAFGLPDLVAKAKFIFSRGLGIGDPSEGQLVDDLFRDVAAAPGTAQELTEDWLQAMFAFRSTLIDPVAPDEPAPRALGIRRRVLESQWRRADASATRPLGDIPIVDPHLIDEVDLMDRVPAALNDNIPGWRPIEFLTRRRLELNSLESLIVAGTAPAPAATRAQRLKDLLVDLATSQSTILGSVIPVPPFGFRDGTDNLDYPRLGALRSALNLRQDASADLTRFQISEADVRAIVGFIERIDTNQAVTDSETSTFRRILFAHGKRVGFWPTWLQQEQQNAQQRNGLALEPGFFRTRVTSGEAPDPQWLPRPRLADWDERLRWDEILNARRRVLDEMATDLAVIRVRLEGQLLPELRNVLIAATNSGVYSLQRAAALTDQYQLDFEAGGCQRTTRVTQAIQTIQGLLFGARHGLLNDRNWTLADPHFDEIWRWIGTYDTWRAAVMAFLYPENLLRPSLRRDDSPGFLDALQLLRDASPIGEQDAFTAHDRFAQYLNDVAGIDLVAGVSRVLVKGSGGVERTAQYLVGTARSGSGTRVYWSVAVDQFDGRGDQSWWRPIPGMKDVGEIHGASFCGQHWVVLTSSSAATARRLEVWRQKLPPISMSVQDLLATNVPWEGPFALELPSGVNAFDAVTLRAAEAGAAPLVTIEADEQTIYSRPLNLEGKGWSGRFKSSPNEVLWREVGQSDPYGIWPINKATLACRLNGQSPDDVLARAVLAADVDGDGADELIAFPDESGFWAMKIYAIGSRATWLPLGTRPLSQRLDCTLKPPAPAYPLFGAVSGDFDGDRVAEVAALADAVAPADSIYTSWVDVYVQKWNPANGTWAGLGTVANVGTGAQIFAPRPWSELKQVLVGRFTQEQSDELLLCFSDVNVAPSPYFSHFILYRLVNGTWKEGPGPFLSDIVSGAGQFPQTAVAGNFLGQPRHQLIMPQIAGGTPTGRCWVLSFVGGAWRKSSELQAGVISGIPRLVARDFDGDGVDELALADDTPTVRFYKSEGSTWRTAQTVTISGPVDFMAAGDFDADGAVDLMVHTAADPSRGVPIKWDQTLTPAGIQQVDLSLGSVTPVQALVAGRFAGRNQWIGVAALGEGSTFYVQSKKPRTATTAARPNVLRFKPILDREYALTTGAGSDRRLSSSTDVGGAGTAAFQLNVGNRPRNREYLEEAYYFLPVETALRFQSAANYSAALSWLQLAARLIGTTLEAVGPFLTLDASGSLDPIAGTPAIDPLDAHFVARRRPGSYNRFTIMTMVRLLIEYADAEFSLATAESIPRARELYLSALGLLRTHPYAAVLDSCQSILDDLLATLAATPGLSDLVPDVRDALLGLDDVIRLNAIAAAIRAAIESQQNLASRRQAILESLKTATAEPEPGQTIGERLDQEREIEQAAHLEILRDLKADGYSVFMDRGDRLALADAIGRYKSIVLPQFTFCVPPATALLELKRRIELALARLRRCQDIGGNDLIVLPIGRSPERSAGNVAASSASLQPLPYRFPTLIARAKELLEIARQIESSMLSYIDSAERKRYEAINARRDLALAQAATQLRAVQAQQASAEIGLAALQRDHAQDQVDRFSSLLREGLTGWESSGLAAQWAVFGLKQQAVTSIIFKYAATAEGWVSGLTSWGATPAIETVLGQAEATSALAQARFTQAEYERRNQAWGHNLQDARRDVQIGQQQVTIATSRLQGAQIEQQISALQTAFANEVVTFLTTKSFANEALYEWMASVLEGVYRFFLQQATQLARLAELQLAFERQETPQGFIKRDYWSPNSGDSTPDVASVRNATDAVRGLTGAGRLLRDVYQLDQSAFTRNRRKQQLTETISLVQLDPLAFEQFRLTGRMAFETPMELFDRKFPGHYLRLLRRVRLSVIALIPPNTGVRATLSNSGLSRVVVAADEGFRSVVLQRGFEQLSFSSAINATGQFELDAQPDLIAPFEGGGVESRWVVDLPRPANPFDYRSIADLLISFEYTALTSQTLRAKAIALLPTRLAGERVFSLRHEFSDAWYDLHNPDQDPTPLEALFAISRDDFPSNLERVRMTGLVLQVRRRDGVTTPVDIEYLRFRPDVTGATPVGGGAQTDASGVVSTRRASGAAWTQILTSMATAEPAGEWHLKFRPSAGPLFAANGIDDILLGVAFEGVPPPWP